VSTSEIARLSSALLGLLPLLQLLKPPYAALEILEYQQRAQPNDV
jgi:hypothetical protein